MLQLVSLAKTHNGGDARPSNNVFIFLKFHVILDNGPHNRSVFDVSICGHVTKYRGRRLRFGHIRWPYKTGRRCPFVCPSTYHFWISFLVISQTVLKRQMMRLDIGLHNRLVFDFSISGHVTQKYDQRFIIWIIISPSLLNFWISNFVESS